MSRVALGLILENCVAMMRIADRDSVTIGISLFTAAFVVLSKRSPPKLARASSRYILAR